MSLQSRALAMLSIGVKGNVAPNSLQAKVEDGIHLRWGFERSAGFPWYGYYLFRRRPLGGDIVQRSVAFGRVTPGVTSATAPDGSTLTSDSPLALGDDFAPIGQDELDLDGRVEMRLVLPALASQVTLEVGLRQDTEIVATALLQHVPVIDQRGAGKAGQVLTIELPSDAISEVVIAGAPAALVAVRYLPVTTGDLIGWQAVPKFPYPLGLPVAHPDYPLSQASLAAAEAVALARIRYGPAAAWAGGRFAALHAVLLDLVVGGPSGPAMADKVAAVSPTPPDPQLRMPAQSPLDLVLLGALDPALAQIAGLYWLDDTVASNDVYDYLVVADHAGRLGGSPTTALQHLNNNGWAEVDAFIVFGRSLTPGAADLASPVNARAYALPDAPRTSSPTGGAGVAGVRWDLGTAPTGELLPDSAVLYHVWRADLGGAQPNAPGSNFKSLTAAAPVLVGDLPAGAPPPPDPPSDWPPARLRPHYVDRGLAEGWYGYRVSGIDLFGRHSTESVDAPWYQWDPAPDPEPWYYIQPPADKQVHPFAVGLLDKVPPPPPTGVEAAALDAQDPTVLQDAAYTAWRAGLAPSERTVLGLRVRWQWPYSHRLQAPDTREFRIYLRSGRANALLGATGTITETSATETTVDTTIANTRAADAYTGCRLQIGAEAFTVLGSDAGTPLRVRVSNLGADHAVRPAPSKPCTVAIPDGHPLYIDYAEPTTWASRMYVVAYGDAARSQQVADAAGNPLRLYDVFLPWPGDSQRPALPLSASTAEPIAYAQVGVSATDDKTHTGDAPQWAASPWGGAARFGNESRVGGPATIFVVHRTPPNPPTLPPMDSARVWATPADYRSESHYTFRWVPAANLRLHVMRAIDDSVFNVDWEGRPGWAALDPLTPADRALFPTESRWDVAKLQQVAAELNALRALKVGGATKAQAMSAYRALSNDALRVLAGLPSNERAFGQLTIQPLDPGDPANADRRGPDSPAGYTPDAALRAYVDVLDGRASNRVFYRAAYTDAAHNRSGLSLSTPPVYLPDARPPSPPRILKALGGQRRIQLEWSPPPEPALDRYLVYRTQEESRGRDVRLMGAPVADLPAAVLVVRGSMLDLGTTDAVTVERVYAAAGFDPALDLLTGQTAAQYLSAPAAPVAGSVSGLSTLGPTPVVAVYRDSRNGLQRTALPNRAYVWVDEGLTGARTYHHRVVATRVGEMPAGPVTVRSQPSELSAARAVDLTPPAPPTITTLEWVRVGLDGTVYPHADPVPAGATRLPAVRIVWTSTDPALASIVQFTEDVGGGFVNASGWLPRGVYQYVHPNERTFQSHTYRIKVLSAAGNASTAHAPAALAALP
ncbi:hypothetical protein OJ998_01005 [Solirubrobacter taibaiensis]|nr:hypothetical protein [Solirubrobacter taibaiensis]